MFCAGNSVVHFLSRLVRSEPIAGYNACWYALPSGVCESFTACLRCAVKRSGDVAQPATASINDTKQAPKGKNQVRAARKPALSGASVTNENAAQKGGVHAEQICVACLGSVDIAHAEAHATL